LLVLPTKILFFPPLIPLEAGLGVMSMSFEKLPTQTTSPGEVFSFLAF
jgi:hypothetical protein